MNSNLEKLEDIRGLIFDTPFLEVKVKEGSEVHTVYAKYEAKNLTGSIKDRMAFYIIENSYKDGYLKIEQEIIEMSSGNTGISFAALGAILGHKVTIIMPDWLSSERYETIKFYGGNVVKVSKEDGGFIKSLELAKEHQEKCNAFYPNQFANLYNTMAHEETTSQEIIKTLSFVDKTPDHFIAGMGTGGTIMGCYAGFKRAKVDTICYALEPSNSPILTNKGEKIGTHRIQGIVDDFIPELMDMNKIKNIISVDDSDAIAMAKKLSFKGISVGISSGANLMGAIEIAKKYPNDTVTTVFSDDFFKYFSTDMAKETPKELASEKYTVASVKVL